MQIIEQDNYTIINDTYNANKEAMMSAFDTVTMSLSLALGELLLISLTEILIPGQEESIVFSPSHRVNVSE